MKETILFSYKGSGYRKLDTDLACERMDFIRPFLCNLIQPSYKEYVYLSDFNNDNLYSELKNDPKLSDVFIRHKKGLILEVISYSLNFLNLMR